MDASFLADMAFMDAFLAANEKVGLTFFARAGGMRVASARAGSIVETRGEKDCQSAPESELNMPPCMSQADADMGRLRTLARARDVQAASFVFMLPI